MKMHYGVDISIGLFSWRGILDHPARYNFLCGNNGYYFSVTDEENEHTTDDPDKLTCKSCIKQLPGFIVKALNKI